jgi:hypothetical protein
LRRQNTTFTNIAHILLFNFLLIIDKIVQLFSELLFVQFFFSWFSCLINQQTFRGRQHYFWEKLARKLQKIQNSLGKLCKLMWRDLCSQKAHSNQLLTNLDELIPVGILLGFDSASIALSHRALLEIVCPCFLHKDQQEGTSWFRGFMSPHSSCFTQTVKKRFRVWSCK